MTQSNLKTKSAQTRLYSLECDTSPICYIHNVKLNWYTICSSLTLSTVLLKATRNSQEPSGQGPWRCRQDAVCLSESKHLKATDIY